MALFSDNSSRHTEKGEEVAMDIERGSDDAGRISNSQLEQKLLLQNERSNLGGGIESRTMKLDGKDVKGIMMALESIRLTQKHGIDGKSELSAKSEYLSQDREGELEEYAKFAYLTLGLSYSLLYSLLSASLGRTGNKREVMMSVHIWSILMMLLFFLSFYIRCPVGVFKVIRIIMAGLLFISSLFVFVLLQLTL